jgi:hypothetical protein
VLTNLFEALYNKVIVNIVLKHSSCDVYLELCSKKSVIQSQKKTFETLSLNADMLQFITSYTKETPYSYITILDMSLDQGAIPTCKKDKLTYYKDLDSYEYKCFNDKWTYFTLKHDLYEINKMFKQIGVDFIFSPFSLLHNFFEDKINSHIALYILIQESVISVSIFENSQLMFAEHLDIETSGDDELISQIIEEDDDINLGESIGLDLDDVDVIDDMGDLDDLDDFGDIEDLDSLEEIDEFSDSQDIEEELFESTDPIIESSDENINEDYQMFSLIQTSLGHYYNDRHFESQFIENIYIADGVGVSTDLKRYLEEETFLNVYIRHIDISMELCSLAKEELGL